MFLSITCKNCTLWGALLIIEKNTLTLHLTTKVQFNYSLLFNVNICLHKGHPLPVRTGALFKDLLNCCSFILHANRSSFYLDCAFIAYFA